MSGDEKKKVTNVRNIIFMKFIIICFMTHILLTPVLPVCLPLPIIEIKRTRVDYFIRHKIKMTVK